MSSGYHPPITLNKFIPQDFGDLMVDDAILEKISTNMLRTKIDAHEDIPADEIEPLMRALSPGRNRPISFDRADTMNEDDVLKKKSKANKKFYFELFGKRIAKQLLDQKRSEHEQGDGDDMEAI